MSLRILFVLIVMCLAITATSADDSMKALELIDLEGTTQTPLLKPDNPATVLFFVLPDCPISNAYSPEIKRICTEYKKQNVATYVVYVDPDFTVQAAKKHASEYGFECPVLRDTSLELAKETGVTIAPEVAVLGPDGKRLYRGRIDNLYADLGKRRTRATQHDLRDALDAILSGKRVTQETTKSIGCPIQKPTAKTPKVE